MNYGDESSHRLPNSHQGVCKYDSHQYQLCRIEVLERIQEVLRYDAEQLSDKIGKFIPRKFIELKSVPRYQHCRHYSSGSDQQAEHEVPSGNETCVSSLLIDFTGVEHCRHHYDKHRRSRYTVEDIVPQIVYRYQNLLRQERCVRLSQRYGCYTSSDYTEDDSDEHRYNRIYVHPAERNLHHIGAVAVAVCGTETG